MSDIPVALYAFQVVGQMGTVVYLMARVFSPDFTHLVAFFAGFAVDLCSQNRALVCFSHALENIASTIEVSLELSDYSGFGMAIDAISFCVDRSGMSRSLPGCVPRLHHLAACAKARLL